MRKFASWAATSKLVSIFALLGLGSLASAWLGMGAAPASVLGRDGLVTADGAIVYRHHVFPVQGTHWLRGPIGEFGAPRSGGPGARGL